MKATFLAVATTVVLAASPALAEGNGTVARTVAGNAGQPHSITLGLDRFADPVVPASAGSYKAMQSDFMGVAEMRPTPPGLDRFAHPVTAVTPTSTETSASAASHAIPK